MTLAGIVNKPAREGPHWRIVDTLRARARCEAAGACAALSVTGLRGDVLRWSITDTLRAQTGQQAAGVVIRAQRDNG